MLTKFVRIKSNSPAHLKRDIIMLITKFLNPKNDYAFKRIFGTKRNQDILIHFINDILGFSGDAVIIGVWTKLHEKNPMQFCPTILI